MKKVLVFGAFDLLHPGHISLFEQAKKYGDVLAVVVGRDSTIEEVKGKKPKYNEQQRMKAVNESPYVDEVYLGNEEDKYSIIESIKPDIICLGYDQNSFSKDLKTSLVKRGLRTKVVRLEPYEEHKYKSSKLKK